MWDADELDQVQGHRAILERGLHIKTIEAGVATHVIAAFHPGLNAPGKFSPRQANPLPSSSAIAVTARNHCISMIIV